MPSLKKIAVSDSVVLVPGHVVDVPLGMLNPDPNQPRGDFDPAALAELAADIEHRGVENPIRVRSDWTIKHGERRWRASKMAGKQTIPCLLADPAADENPALEWLLDQASDNEQQKKLTPMDWARCLRRLVDGHGLAVKDIPDVLAKRGITMSRSYVSNLMRLDDLPEWAQTLITGGELTASDGKQLLMAKPFPKAMDYIKRQIEDVNHRRAEGVTLREELFRYDHDDMEALVHAAYVDTAIDLTNTYGDNAPRFNWASSCKTCDKRQKIDKDHFCLDEKCFEQKQALATAEPITNGKSEPTRPQKKKPTGPTIVKPDKIDEHGVITLKGLSRDKYQLLDAGNVRFETAMHCTGCEHNRLAVHYKDGKPAPTCFNLPCFEQKQRGGNREEGVAQWLDKRLLPLVLAKLANNYDLQFQLLAWMALGAPTQTDREQIVFRQLGIETRREQKKQSLRHPGGVIEAYTNQRLNAEAVAAAGVRALLADRGHFYAFARHLGLKLTPAIAHLDAEYVDLKRKSELVEILHLAGFTDSRTDSTTADAGKAGDTKVAPVDKLKLDELVAVCLSEPVVEAVGIPADVYALYQNIQPEIDPDFDNSDWDDDVSEETEEEN